MTRNNIKFNFTWLFVGLTELSKKIFVHIDHENERTNHRSQMTIKINLSSYNLNTSTALVWYKLCKRRDQRKPN